MNLEEYLRIKIKITLRNIKEAERENQSYVKCYNEGLKCAYNEVLNEISNKEATQ